MSKLFIYSKSGTKSSQTINLTKKIFDVKINKKLMAQAIRVFLSNQRQASARTKSRGEVVTSKKKIWKQKGTGRARHSSRNAPLFVGGAKAHGPTGAQNYKRKLMKTQKRQSLFSSLTQQLKDKNILVVKDLDKIEPKTKNFNKLFNKLFKNPKKVLLITLTKTDSINRGINNLQYLKSTNVKTLNTYTVINANKLIFTPEAINELEKHYVK